MSCGTIKKFKTEYDTEEELRVLCSFSVDKRRYLLSKNEDGEYCCRELGWNLFKGTHVKSGPVETKVLRAADLLLRQADKHPEFYEFGSEHYEIASFGRKYRIRKLERLSALHPFAKFVPVVLRIIAAMLIAIGYGFICLNTSEITVAENVFGDMSGSALAAAVYIIQALGALLLFFVRRDDRDLFDLFLNALIPYNTIALIGALRISKAIRISSVVVFAASLAVYILPKVIKAIKAKQIAEKKEYLKTALRRFLAPLVICVCAVFISTHFLGFSLYMYSSDEEVTRDLSSAEAIISVKDDLQFSKWETLNVSRKLDVLQIICDYECETTLGCASAKVVAGVPERDSILGSYSEHTNTILINVDHLKEDTVVSVLETLLHEARHAYQHAFVKAFNSIKDSLDDKIKALSAFRTAEDFRKNFRNYIDGGNDYEAYFAQAVERDSRSWACSRLIDDYYSIIFPYSDGEEDFDGWAG